MNEMAAVRRGDMTRSRTGNRLSQSVGKAVYAVSGSKKETIPQAGVGPAIAAIRISRRSLLRAGSTGTVALPPRLEAVPNELCNFSVNPRGAVDWRQSPLKYIRSTPPRGGMMNPNTGESTHAERLNYSYVISLYHTPVSAISHRVWDRRRGN